MASYSQFSNNEMFELGWKDDPMFQKSKHQLIGAPPKASWRNALSPLH